MRHAVLAIITLTLLAGCSNNKQAPADLIDPDFVVRQTSAMPYAARHVQGAIPVTFQVDVINKSAETLKLETLRLETIGAGAYVLPLTSRPFDREIKPNHVETVELQLTASAQDTIQGSNGVVTIKGTAHLRSPYGAFQKTFIQQINDGMKGQPQAH